MNERTEFFKKDALAAHLGIELLEVSDGGAKARMPLKDFHNNMLGIVHGGAVFTLADHVFAASVNSYGQVAVAIHVSISYLRGVKGDILYADSREVSRNPKLATHSISVRDEEGNLVAMFEGMAYIKNQKILFVQGTVIPLK